LPTLNITVGSAVDGSNTTRGFYTGLCGSKANGPLVTGFVDYAVFALPLSGTTNQIKWTVQHAAGVEAMLETISAMYVDGVRYEAIGKFGRETSFFGVDIWFCIFQGASSFTWTDGQVKALTVEQLRSWNIEGDLRATTDADDGAYRGGAFDSTQLKMDASTHWGEIRIPVVNVPANAIITDATLRLDSNANPTGSMSGAVIKGYLGNAPALSGVNAVTASKTTASTTLPTSNAGDRTFLDVTAIVQEIVNGTWTSGNALLLMLNAPSAANVYYHDYNSSGGDLGFRPKLDITWATTLPPIITSPNSGTNALGTTLSFPIDTNETTTRAIIGGTNSADFAISGGNLTWAAGGVSSSVGPKVVTVRATSTADGETVDQTITINVIVAIPQFGAITAGFGNQAAFSLTITAIRGLGRIMCVGLMSANQVPAAVAGWNKLVPDSGSTGRGTAGAAGGLLGTVYWRVSDGTETTFAVSDSGDIQYVVAWSYVPDSGKTLEFGPSIADNFAAGTAGSFPGVTTPSDGHAVITVLFTDRDSTASSWAPLTYGNEANGVERFDLGTSTGTGGGIAVLTGELQAAGATGTVTATQAASAVHSYITFTLRHVPDAPTLKPYSFGFIA
jgi:hypothetical protein